MSGNNFWTAHVELSTAMVSGIDDEILERVFVREMLRLQFLLVSQESLQHRTEPLNLFLFRRKVQDLLTTIEETGSKVGRHRIPLGGITTALWWTLGRESPAYLSDLQGHFLFPTHPPGYVPLPLFGLGDRRGFYSQVGSLEIG